jgi:hypothetical protein
MSTAKNEMGRGMTPGKFAGIAHELCRIIMLLPPEKAQAALGGFIANIVGPIPNEYWESMKRAAAQPCGRIDCGCETLRNKLFDTLDLQRTDWLEQVRGE